MGFQYIASLSDSEARSLAIKLGISSSVKIASLPAEITRLRATMLGIPQDAWTQPFTSGRIAPMNPLDPTFIPCTVLTPSRSDIALVQDVPNGVLGQQITYLLILRAS